nr:MAG TPA: hypothetical protein [Caudoviricetes sp.]
MILRPESTSCIYLFFFVCYDVISSETICS